MDDKYISVIVLTKKVIGQQCGCNKAGHGDTDRSNDLVGCVSGFPGNNL